MTFNVEEHIYSCDGSGDIDILISGYIASVAAMAYSAIGLAGLAYALVTCRNRRRRVATPGEGELGQYKSNVEFIQMDEDSSYVVA